MYTDDEFKAKLSHSLRRERLERGIDAIEVAKKMNLTKSAISNYETGRNNMSAAAVKQYCEAIGTNISDFFSKYFG